MSAPSALDGAPPFARDRLVHGYVVASAVSRAGDAFWTVALAWTAVELASPAVAGLVVAAGTVPRALVLLYGGVVADRCDALRVMRVTNAVRAGVLLGVGLVDLLGTAPIPLLVVVAVTFGVADALYDPCAATVPRQLVRRDDLPAYAGLSQTAQRIGTMLGAALGGVVVGVGGLGASAAVDAATFLAMGAYLLLLRPRYPLARDPSGSVLAGLRAGFQHLRDEPTVRSLVLALSGLNLVVGPALALGVALRASEAGWGAHLLGVAEAVVALSAAAGSLILARRQPVRLAVWGFGLLVVQGAAVVALGVGGRGVLIGACAVIGITAGAASVALGGLFLAVVHESYVGRMASILALGDDVLIPAAMAGFGGLAAASPTPVPFAVYGGAMVVVMVLFLARPGVRSLGAPVPAPAEAAPDDVDPQISAARQRSDF
ncbi:MFS family permease [Nocardioides thalensis]|uniref:MFS family permease n=1 Tax=Nocardioides thalensis TaxID=1914755 RepID=A0A853BYB4_9ACTN|nr:MFS family permease [Nocardioides thalensis]